MFPLHQGDFLPAIIQCWLQHGSDSSAAPAWIGLGCNLWQKNSGTSASVLQQQECCVQRTFQSHPEDVGSQIPASWGGSGNHIPMDAEA